MRSNDIIKCYNGMYVHNRDDLKKFDRDYRICDMEFT